MGQNIEVVAILENRTRKMADLWLYIVGTKNRDKYITKHVITVYSCTLGVFSKFLKEGLDGYIFSVQINIESACFK